MKDDVTLSPQEETDFWWLTAEEKQKYQFVELVHHEPLKEEDKPAYSAFANPDLVDVKNINQWRQQYENTNVYRSLKVWADELKKNVISGPFIIDIDNEFENLSDALVVTKEAIEYLRSSYSVKDDTIRVFFTGHKGFNIEINPKALKIQGALEEQKSRGESIRKEVIKKLQQGKKVVANTVSERHTLIDQIQEYVRLHGSFNRWVSPKGELAHRKKEFAINELYNLTIESIIEKSDTS